MKTRRRQRINELRKLYYFARIEEILSEGEEYSTREVWESHNQRFPRFTISRRTVGLYLRQMEKDGRVESNWPKKNRIIWRLKQ